MIILNNNLNLKYLKQSLTDFDKKKTRGCWYDEER